MPVDVESGVPDQPIGFEQILAGARHRAAWLIDWHNTAFSILALKHGRHAWLIALSRAIEACPPPPRAPHPRSVSP